MRSIVFNQYFFFQLLFLALLEIESPKYPHVKNQKPNFTFAFLAVSRLSNWRSETQTLCLQLLHACAGDDRGGDESGGDERRAHRRRRSDTGLKAKSRPEFDPNSFKGFV
ncbi:hypothetical protein Q3G72_001701 [Acer saccharum]|nr:hypothetical protein Q3G72_001701 [Acer saccharum]